jgi:hypothetical protein
VTAGVLLTGALVLAASAFAGTAAAHDDGDGRRFTTRRKHSTNTAKSTTSRSTRSRRTSRTTSTYTTRAT